MAEAVVDQLEAVEVKEEDGVEAAVAPRPCERPGQRLVERGAVRETGEVVVVGVEGELLLELLTLGYVVKVGDEATHRRVIEEVRDADLRPPPAAVAMQSA